MVGQRITEPVAGKPADGQIALRLPRQRPVVHDAEKKAREHQADGGLRGNARATALRIIAVRDRLTQPAQVQDGMHPLQDMVVGNELHQGTGEKDELLVVRLANHQETSEKRWLDYTIDISITL